MNAYYRLEVKPVSRGKGRSATGAAAYRAGCKIVDDRSGDTHDYRRRRGVVSDRVILPDGAPAWAQDPTKLWNAAEAAETRSNARVAREIILALPAQLDADARAALAHDFAKHLAARYGVAAHVLIHLPDRRGDQRGHHAHVLVSGRSLSADGFGGKVRVLDDRDQGPIEVEWMRSTWASLINDGLAAHDIAARVDHRSYERQGIERIPGKHLGPADTARERRGQSTRRGRYNARVQAINALLAARRAAVETIKTRLHKLRERLAVLRAAAARQAAEPVRAQDIVKSAARARPVTDVTTGLPAPASNIPGRQFTPEQIAARAVVKSAAKRRPPRDIVTGLPLTPEPAPDRAQEPVPVPTRPAAPPAKPNPKSQVQAQESAPELDAYDLWMLAQRDGHGRG